MNAYHKSECRKLLEAMSQEDLSAISNLITRRPILCNEPTRGRERAIKAILASNKTPDYILNLRKMRVEYLVDYLGMDKVSAKKSTKAELVSRIKEKWRSETITGDNDVKFK